jgi:hypothetical protein
VFNGILSVFTFHLVDCLCQEKKNNYKELLLRDLFQISTFKFSSIVRLKHNQSFVTPQWAVRIMYKVISR